MSPEANAGTPSEALKSVLDLINELAIKSDGGKYVYRGERKPYPKVSSSLYRRYEDIDTEGFDIEVVQAEILEQARQYARYTGEVDDLEILSQLQHFGGETNLIDFTTDFLIALFFASDGETEEPGRVILLSESGVEYRLDEPKIPVHRVIAQKSVFVRPDKGFVEPDATVTIHSRLKPAVLDYLRDRHGISGETIYNDLHGFIRHQSIHQSAYIEFHKGRASTDQGNYQQAIAHYTNTIKLNPQIVPAYYNRALAYNSIGDYGNALQDYAATLVLNPDHIETYTNIGIIYAQLGNHSQAIQFYDRAVELGDTKLALCNRGEAWLHLGDWERARDDLTRANNEGMDIAASFRNDYKNVADFEQRNGLKLPEDIAKMLGG